MHVAEQSRCNAEPALEGFREASGWDVVMLATGPEPVQLYPALQVEPDATIADFDAAHPKGADYVIVPAMSRDDDPAVLAWLQEQSRKGARIIGICAGAKVVGAAGLLDGRRPRPIGTISPRC